jgi:hypothetical protein
MIYSQRSAQQFLPVYLYGTVTVNIRYYSNIMLQKNKFNILNIRSIRNNVNFFLNVIKAIERLSAFIIFI